MNEPSLKTPLLRVALATGLLLLIPLVAMQLSPEVSWEAGDFLVAATLLFAAGTALVLAWRRFRGVVHRAAVTVAVALGLAMVWAELAVGLFD